MNWQYRTILFEFQKDGLLGDKYVDDEEMEKILNEQGDQGWELVSVTTVQEGLLTFFKRQQAQPASQASARVAPPAPQRPMAPQRPAAVSPPGSGGQPPVRVEPPPAAQPSQTQQPQAPKKKPSTIGEIKIS